jgi:hypothetical protein
MTAHFNAEVENNIGSVYGAKHIKNLRKQELMKAIFKKTPT